MFGEAVVLVGLIGAAFILGYLRGWESRDRDCEPTIPDTINLSGPKPPNCS